MSAQAVEPDVGVLAGPVGEEAGAGPAPRLRLLPAPACEPAVPTLAVVPVVPVGGPSVPAVRTLGTQRRSEVPVPLAPGPPPARDDGDLPDPARWARQFVQAAVEVAVGLRPAAQLVRWTDEEVYARLARRCDVATRARVAGRLRVPPGRTRVRSVRASTVARGVVEASAVVSDGTRVRAVALRLEGHDGRWRVTVLELG